MATDTHRSPAADGAQAPQGGPDYWRSLEEHMDTPEFREMLYREFPEDATEWTDPVSRRHFLQLMGASLALGVGIGCSPRPAPLGVIMPYVTQPDLIVPGNPLFFATALNLSGTALGVLVKSREGRPIKIEGNPSHPSSQGRTDLLAQAAILTMYDPDRSKRITQNGVPASWEGAQEALKTAVENRREAKGKGIRLLTESISSPTLVDQIQRFLKQHPEAKWVQYEPVNRDNVHEGARRAFGQVVTPVYQFDKAKVVLALDHDFTNSGPGCVRYAGDFMAKRRVRKDDRDGVKPEAMNRLYVVETMPSPTGASSDHRLPLTPLQLESFARTLASELGVENVPQPGALPKLAQNWVKPLADDLKEKGKNALVSVGDHLSASVHALVHAINLKLGNTGETVKYVEPIDAQPSNQNEDLRQLTQEMNDGTCEVLIMLNTNPVYTAPVDIDFRSALKTLSLDKKRVSFHLDVYQDETAVLSNWHLPAAFDLERWGDGRGHDGTVALMQPLIAPLYDGISPIELMSVLLVEAAQDGREVVRNHWREVWKQEQRTGDFESFWQSSLREGVVRDTARAEVENLTLQANWSEGDEPIDPAKGLEIAFRPDPCIYDGRFANNGWLQEVPKPITKITWGNVVFMSPRKAKEYGFSVTPVSLFMGKTAGERGRGEVDLVQLSYQGRRIVAPVWILPGHPDEAITVHLGFGRKIFSRDEDFSGYARVANEIGFNAYSIRTSDGLWNGSGVDLDKTGETDDVACVQMHHNMEGRKPVRRGNLEEYQEGSFDFVKIPSTAANEVDLFNQNLPLNDLIQSEHGHDHDHEHEDEGHDEGHHDHDSRLVPLTVYPDMNHYKDQRRWSMAIDLTSCTGCNACMVACQAENNIPIVGKTEVTRGREMHWIRIDRYYKGEPEDSASIDTYLQPVPCQQCEKAPCELVCPVGATVHSADGLNDMVYNRCVGTRYCSNNCPYKVRRFNFFSYADYTTEVLKLGRNPEVTVRSRGIMEKCTYCVQRIRAAEIVTEREYAAGKRKEPKIEDGEILTACQSACPTGAIVFGDLADTSSVVRRWKEEPLNYGLLAELNTMPRTTYLASVRNPNPNMPQQPTTKAGGE